MDVERCVRELRERGALVWRWWRWIGLTDEFVVFVAEDDAAWARLEREAALLARWNAPFLPRVVALNRGLRAQIRERGHGQTGLALERAIFGTDRAVDRYATDCPITAIGERLADDLGRALARLHMLGARDGLAIGLPTFSLARALDLAEPVIAAHAPELSVPLDRARAYCEALTDDAVVVHGDPHLHNMVADDDGSLRTLFDLDDAAVAHRAVDLRYLPSHGPRFVRIALDAYGFAEEETVRRVHAACALEHFGFVAPDAPRFPSIVSWAHAALDAFAPDWRS